MIVYNLYIKLFFYFKNSTYNETDSLVNHLYLPYAKSSQKEKINYALNGSLDINEFYYVEVKSFDYLSDNTQYEFIAQMNYFLPYQLDNDIIKIHVKTGVPLKHGLNLAFSVYIIMKKQRIFVICYRFKERN